MKIAYQGEPGAFSEAAGPASRPRCAARCRARASRTSSPRSATGRRPTASCRSRTRLAAAFIATTTCWSRTSCRFRPRSSCRSSISCWRCRARPSSGCGACIRTRRRSPSASGFLRTLKGIDIIATYDTAGSAKMVADERLDGRRRDRVGAGRRGVRSDARWPSSIQDFDDNITRFLVIGREPIHRRRRRTRRRSSSRCRTSRARCSRR